MAIGGPETSLALGQLPDVDAAIAAGNAASAVADPSIPVQTTGPAAVDPTQPQQPQITPAGGGLKFTTKPANYGGQRMTAQDFVPHPDPYSITAYGQGGSEPAFNLPAPAIAARLQGLAQEQAELNKVTEQAFAQDKKPVVPAQYSRSFNNLYSQGDDELRKSVMEQYGGREDLAAKALAGKDPNNLAAHRAYLKFHKDMDDLGRVMTHNVDEAMLNIQQMKTGERPWDQASFDASQDLLRGFNELGQGGYGDVQKLTQIAQNYDRTTSLPYTLAQKGKDGMSLDDHIRNNMATSFTKNPDGSPKFRVDRAGRFTVLTHEDLKTAETILDGLTEELWPRFDAQYDSKEEFRARMGQLYPVKVELVKDAVHDPSAGSAAAANKKPSVGFAEVGFDSTVPGLHQTEGDGVKRRTPVSISMPLKDGDGKPFTESFRFNDGAGTPMRVIPDGFRMNDKGEVFIVGRDSDVTKTQTENAGKVAVLKAEVDDIGAQIKEEMKGKKVVNNVPEPDKVYQARLDGLKKDREKKILEANAIEREVTKEKPAVPIPLKGNEAKVKTYFGEQVYNDVMQQAAAAKQTKKAPSASPISYNKVKAKLPAGATQADFDEAMKTPEGRAYIESLK